jgi:glycosyltransferase involved in cell wall biosynthesis
MVSIMNCLGPLFSHHIVSLDEEFGASKALSGGIQAVVGGPPPKSWSIPYALVFRRMVAGLRPAAVLTYNWGAIEATLGARIAGQCPVIHNECGFGLDESNGLLRRRIWAKRALLSTAFRTVVTSKTLLSIALTQYKLPARKVQLIRTGVDVNRFQSRRNTAGRRDVGIGEGDFLFGYVGGLRPEKNLSLLLESFHTAQLPNSTLLLTGEGPCRGELESLVRNLGIQSKVIFAGHRADTAPILGMLDAFVMSSATEQVSNAQLEAMASGLPVICTDVGDCRELLGESAEHCVAPLGDSNAYSHALRRIATDPELRSALGAANRARTVDRYSKERMVGEYQALLEQAIGIQG